MTDRYFINGQEIDFNKCAWNIPPPPVGDELRNFLHLWLIKAIEAHIARQYFPASINWAVRRRVMEVLDWLDASSDPLDYEAAKALRRIGTMDRVHHGYANGMFALNRYGLLALELGNRTWDPRNNRDDNRGEAAQAYFLRYGEQPYFK